MSDADPQDPAPVPQPPQPPDPVLARSNRLRLSLVWTVPIIAVIVGAVLVVRALLQTGPEIEIEFRSAEGLEAGRTEVRYKEVMVGRVKAVNLSPDRQRVLVRVGLVKSAAGLAVEDTRFWVVRPRIGTAGVSGLSTLLSGSYIGVDAGTSEESQKIYTGLDTPPLVLRGEPGRSFVLRADDLGSLDVGSPVYHRRVRVGRVVGYALDDRGRSLLVKVFIEAPHDPLVTTRSHFWNASGVDLSLSAAGLTVHTQTIASVLAGGIAFADGPEEDGAAAPPAPAKAGAEFRLYGTQRDAMAPEDGDPMRVRMVFRQSLRGLEVGAPVELLGVSLGTVRGVELQSDPRGGTGSPLKLEVRADIYPKRLGRLREAYAGADRPLADRQLLADLVGQGLRAQARTGNLLTGQLYVALDFVAPKPGGPPRGRGFDPKAEVPLLPTVPGTLAELQPQLAEVVSRISKVRFDEIGSELQGTLAALRGTGTSLQGTLASAEGMIKQLTPTAQQALSDVRQTLAAAQTALKNADASLTDPQAPLQRGAQQTMAEVQRAAQALRVLADYLQRHPESLLRGKPADAVEAPR